MLRTLITVMLISMSSTAWADELQDVDPLEDLNRQVYKFNFEVLDPLFVRPVAVTYDNLTPKFVRKGISNFFANLDEIPNSINSLLQGKFGQASNDLGRLLINSSIGIGGLLDVATSAGLHANQGEDFGQTLATWGVSEGPYLMLPFFGPSTLRDAPSNFIDSFLDPFSYNDSYAVRAGIKAVDIIALRADLLGVDDVMSGDKYLFVRDVYLQNREFLISDGAIEDDFDDLEDY